MASFATGDGYFFPTTNLLGFLQQRLGISMTRNTWDLKSELVEIVQSGRLGEVYTWGNVFSGTSTTVLPHKAVADVSK